MNVPLNSLPLGTYHCVDASMQVLPPQSNPGAQRNLYDFGMQGHAKYLSERSNENIGNLIICYPPGLIVRFHGRFVNCSIRVAAILAVACPCFGNEAEGRRCMSHSILLLYSPTGNNRESEWNLYIWACWWFHRCCVHKRSHSSYLRTE